MNAEEYTHDMLLNVCSGKSKTYIPENFPGLPLASCCILVRGMIAGSMPVRELEEKSLYDSSAWIRLQRILAHVRLNCIKQPYMAVKYLEQLVMALGRCPEMPLLETELHTQIVKHQVVSKSGFSQCSQQQAQLPGRSLKYAMHKSQCLHVLYKVFGDACIVCTGLTY